MQLKAMRYAGELKPCPVACIAEDNPNAARRLLARVKENAALLLENPELGHNGRVKGTRELVVSGTSHT